MSTEVAAEILAEVAGELKISNRTELNLDCGSGDP
jgi:hypothetical protein